MRSSRAPEGRGRTRKPALYFSLILLLILAVLAVVYFTQGFGSLSAKTPRPESPQSGVQALPAPAGEPVAPAASVPAVPTPSPTVLPTPKPTATPLPTPTAAPAPTPTALPTSVPAEASGPAPELPPELKMADALALLPEVDFGEVLGEGVAQLKLPGGQQVAAWYTFQVDTRTRDITVYFAQFDRNLESVVSTVKVDNYSQGNGLEQAELTFYYPDGSDRVLNFDRAGGTMALTQHYKLPFGPSMFSSPLRRALVYYGMKLTDETGDITVELHLDVGGLSDSEEMVFKRLAPGEVAAVLDEIKVLVDQIEEQRLG